MITNPENLSKERLKGELKKKGISFNAQENKKYYVDLYRNKVMVPDSMRTEFSDDDVKASPAAKRKGAKCGRKSKKRYQAPSPVSSRTSYVQHLNNDELMDELIDFGQDPGPITSLTRGVYERKLTKLLQQGERSLGEGSTTTVVVDHGNDSFMGEWSDEDDDDEEEEEDDDDDDDDDDEDDDRHHGHRRHPRLHLKTPELERHYNLRRREIPPPPELMQLRRRSPIPTKPMPPKLNIPKTTIPRPSRVVVPPSEQSETPPKSDPTPPLPTPPPYRPPGRRSDTCRTIWSFILLLIVFLVVFLLYEHVTVPPGKASLLKMGYARILTAVRPLMAKQEVELGPDETKPDDPPLAPPPVNENVPPKDPAPPKAKDQAPPKAKDQAPPKAKDQAPPPEKKPKNKPTDKPKTDKPKKTVDKAKTPTKPAASEPPSERPPPSKPDRNPKLKAS